jgi:hypothetical protein
VVILSGISIDILKKYMKKELHLQNKNVNENREKANDKYFINKNAF